MTSEINVEQRQPIVAVLGHVDHGKTSILDHIRSLGIDSQSSVMAREAGGITQHIGATEIPSELLNEVCGNLLGGKKFNSPGLLFIDTPGHHSFTALRSRGGALADIAILVIDVLEGCQPQTLESIRILKQQKTPFVLALNKIDRIHGWECKFNRSTVHSMKNQSKEALALFEQKFWELVGKLSEQGFNVDLYSKISDFTDTIAAVPCSAKEGEGIQDLLAITVGLAERFLGDRLKDVHGEAEGTILELKDEQGLGKTLDLILYKGTLSKGDEILLVSQEGPFWSHIKGMFSPRGMSEMRDAGDRWDTVETVSAAGGIKINGPNFDKVLVGTTLRVFSKDDAAILQKVQKLTTDIARANADGKMERVSDMKNQRNIVLEEISAEAFERFKSAKMESKISVQLEEEGVVIKSDTLGGLEALAFELEKISVPIRSATIGEVKKKDIRAAEISADPLHCAILSFNTSISKEAAEALEKSKNINLIEGQVIYHILEKFEEWMEIRQRELAESKREDLVHPGKIKLLKDHVFRRNNPAVVGIRVLGGRIKVGQNLLKLDGKKVGQIRSIRIGEDSMKEAENGQEVALAIKGVTIGRQVDEEDILLVDIPSSHASKLQQMDLSASENQILQELIEIHRIRDHFWGR
ncbi:MAG: Translation initiation factor IF-2 [Methanobacteriota archaeon]|nr:MAG: Translation initiation factor IF-2 [Euryarchaeota archaeon]